MFIGGHDVRVALVAGAVATVVTALVQGALIGRGDPRLGYWLLLPVVGALTVRALTSFGSPASDGKLWPLFRRPDPEVSPSLPASLRRVERLVRHGPRDTHTAAHRLLPSLRALADERLADLRGIDWDHPGAKAILGEGAWAMLSPTWAEERSPDSPGPSPAELDSLVAAIEQIRR